MPRRITIKDFDDQPFMMYSPYESRYFHDLLVALFTRADILPRYVQHLSQIHSILAMVRAGLGLAIVPAAAASLKIADVAPAAAEAAQPRAGRAVHGLAPRRRESAAVRAGRNRGELSSAEVMED